MFIKIRSDFCLLSDYKYTCCGIVYGEWLIDLCCLQFGILVVLYKVIYMHMLFNFCWNEKTSFGENNSWNTTLHGRFVSTRVDSLLQGIFTECPLVIWAIKQVNLALDVTMKYRVHENSLLQYFFPASSEIILPVKTLKTAQLHHITSHSCILSEVFLLMA